MYYNLWNIPKATSHYFSIYFSDQETFKKGSWQLGSECPSSYGTLKASIALQILTNTGDRYEKASCMTGRPSFAFKEYLLPYLTVASGRFLGRQTFAL